MTSVVLPLFNEAESLATLHEELARAFADRPVEFVFVDDGSTDASWRVIRDLAAADPRVRAVRLRRNFGKAAALTAGFAEARGEVVLTLDADPSRTTRRRLGVSSVMPSQGALTWSRAGRRRPRPLQHKVGPSRLFNWVVSRWTGCHLHDHKLRVQGVSSRGPGRGRHLRRACTDSFRCSPTPGDSRLARSSSTTGPAGSGDRSMVWRG